MTTLRLGVLWLARAPLRTVTRLVVLAAASALLGAMVLFVGHSLGTMTGSAVRGVPLDWQGPVGDAGAATSVARRVTRQPGVAEAVPAATAPFARIASRAATSSAASARPFHSTTPDVGSTRPPMTWRSVVLPDPDRPTSATRSWPDTVRSAPSSAATRSSPTA